MAWLPIPSSAVNAIRGLFSGTVVDVLWKLLVGSFLVLMVFVMVSLGVIGAAIASMILFSLLSETVRKFIIDLWNRDFYEL